MGDPLEVSDIYQEVKWVFRDSVLSKADVIQATRDAVCIFKELQCLTPRGRFSLDPPIKQGQTRYHFLILLFSKEEDLSLSLNMTECERERMRERETVRGGNRNIRGEALWGEA
ncbi:FACT complex subunit SSRP1-like isoform X1 [Oncorhynchus masou masou]|uniref:FACT complex subunit SSRP1-like isoform X1 n=1 Tax=Oncorhynchus masou masou TaxID=90313 RepID=UPI003183C62E